MHCHTLRVKILDDCADRGDVFDYYDNLSAHYAGDCGVDLIFPKDTNLYAGVEKVNLGIAAEMIAADGSNEGYCLYPRSSISNTPLMLANSVGVIDPQYRGPLIGAFRVFVNCHAIKKGERLLQIVAFDGKPIKVEVVNCLSITERGCKGFGSTNKFC